MTSMRNLLPPERAIPDAQVEAIQSVLIQEAARRRGEFTSPLRLLRRYSIPPLAAALVLLSSVGAAAYFVAVYPDNPEDLELVAPSPNTVATTYNVELGTPGSGLERLCQSVANALSFPVPCPTQVPAGEGAEIRPPRCLSNTAPLANSQAGDLECQVGDWFLMDLSFSATDQGIASEGVIVISAVEQGQRGGERPCSGQATGQAIEVARVPATLFSCAKGAWDYGSGPWESVRWTRANVVYEVTAGLVQPGAQSSPLRELANSIASRIKFVEVSG